MDWDICYGDVIIDPLYMQLVAMVIAQETDAY